MTGDVTVDCIDGMMLRDEKLLQTLTTCLNSGLNAANQLVFAAFRNGQVVGALLANRRRTAAMLRLVKVWVPPHDDAEGVGIALISALEKWSKTAGVYVWRVAVERAADDVPESFLALLDMDTPDEGKPYVERSLNKGHPSLNPKTPIYTQSTDFTCGAACLMMAFAAFDKSIPLQRNLELQLWREATSIVSLDGPGGCDPYGVALAAASRGFQVQVFLSTRDPVLIEEGDTDANRDIIAFAQSDLKSRVLDRGVQVEERAFSTADLRQAIERGASAIVLVDQLETHGRVVPHWIVVHSATEEHFLVNDPWFERGDQEQPADVVDVPISATMLERMCWYGTPPYRAAVFIEPIAAQVP